MAPPAMSMTPLSSPGRPQAPEFIRPPMLSNPLRPPEDGTPVIPPRPWNMSVMVPAIASGAVSRTAHTDPAMTLFLSLRISCLHPFQHRLQLLRFTAQALVAQPRHAEPGRADAGVDRQSVLAVLGTAA